MRAIIAAHELEERERGDEQAHRAHAAADVYQRHEEGEEDGKTNQRDQACPHRGDGLALRRARDLLSARVIAHYTRKVLHALTQLALVGSASVGVAADEPGMRKLFDFADPSATVGWYAIDDRVMGGVSLSRLEPSQAGASFTGALSLERGGGFASVRSADRDLVLSDARVLILRVLGDGKRYKVSLRTDRAFDGVVYQASFATVAGVWQDLTVSLESFVATWRGRPVPGAPALDPSRIRSFGLMISERQSGPFRLDLAWIGVAGPSGDDHP